jgi:hypothetical protein
LQEKQPGNALAFSDELDITVLLGLSLGLSLTDHYG